MRTVIICAMKEEAEKIVKAYKMREIDSIWWMKVYKCEEVYLVLCWIGKANAAKATTYACVFLQAERVINIGVAGAVNPKYNVGDAFIVSKVYPLDTYVPFDWYDYFTEWCVPSIMGSTCVLWTSDKFITNKARIKEWVDLVDMEGIAVANVCEDFRVRYAIIKSVSDWRNENWLDFMQGLELAMDNGIVLMSNFIL